MKQFIKVRVSDTQGLNGESLWAKTTDQKGVVCLDNDADAYKYQIGDLVKIDEDHNVLGLANK